MSAITFQYSAWYLLLCVAVGLLGAGLLYYRFNQFADHPLWLRRLLAALRFGSLTLLAMLLLSPLLKSRKTTTQKPIIVIAQDASASVGLGLKDSTAYRNALQQLKEALAKEYEVAAYTFGTSVNEEWLAPWAAKSSNLAAPLQQAYDVYSNQNLGAVILATDGIYNEGSNPLYIASKLSAPIYTIALGDTTLRKDVTLKRVFNNNIAYLGDKFTIQTDIAAGNCQGRSTTLTVAKIDDNGNARTLSQQAISITSPDFFTTKELVVNTEAPGIQHYRLSLSRVDGEVTFANNVRDVFIEVIDARQKILLFANAPHPDISTLRQAIEVNKNYQVTVAYAKDPLANFAAFDAVIFHQLPTKTNDLSATLAALNTKRTPRLFIWGLQTDLVKANAVQNVVGVVARAQSGNEVQATVNTNFNLFTIEPFLAQQLPNFNPLLSPFGEYKLGGNAQALLYQKIGKVATQYPLLAFGEQDGIRTGVLCAEGLWRWRLFDYLQHQNHEIVNGMIGKSLQYLAVKEDKRRFRAISAKNVFGENEPVIIDAELYNASYELINEPDAFLTITNTAKKDFTYTFAKAGKSYTLNAGSLPVGDYTFKATVNVAGENLSATGKFSIQPLQIELADMTANHALLRTLSEQSGGSTVTEATVAALVNAIQTKNTIKPVMYTSNQTESVINVRWLFGLLLLLLATEWFLRKYFGSY